LKFHTFRDTVALMGLVTMRATLQHNTHVSTTAMAEREALPCFVIMRPAVEQNHRQPLRGAIATSFAIL
jgi:hypothetical protein